MFSQSILSYRGPLTFSTIDLLLSEFKLAAQENDISFRAYKKMVSVMIEALENISKYGDQFNRAVDKNKSLSPCCYINSNSGLLELITCNPVKKKDVKALRSRIDRVNDSSREELKELYRTTITNGEFTAKGGAGLGFIEMAKTTGNPLEYTFENLSGDYTLYTFRVVLDI